MPSDIRFREDLIMLKAEAQGGKGKVRKGKLTKKQKEKKKAEKEKKEKKE